jgi:hypothetical protein
MDCITKYQEMYTICNQEASTLADGQVTIFLCLIFVQRGLHSDQGWNFESRFIQEVLEYLKFIKTRIIVFRRHSNGVVERHVKRGEGNLKKVFSLGSGDRDNMPPIFLLADR